MFTLLPLLLACSGPGASDDSSTHTATGTSTSTTTTSSGTMTSTGTTGGTTGGTTSGSTSTGTTSTVTLPAWTGTLDAAYDHIVGPLSTGRDSEAYTPAGSALIGDFERVGQRLAVGNIDVLGLLQPHGYEALMAWDAINARDVVLVWEAAATHHRGALMVGLGTARSVILESPHAQYDSDTDEEGFEFFVSLEARAWLTATTHRCANSAASGCSGTTSACTSNTAYAESDQAHTVDAAFQALHTGLTDGDSALIVAQLHGFSHSPGEPMVYVSNGTTTDATGTLSNALADELDTLLAEGGASCNLASDSSISRLCGTHNAQGRQLNGSASACDTAASSASGRFLHIEQARDLRDNTGAIHRGLMTDALDAVLP